MLMIFYFFFCGGDDSKMRMTWRKNRHRLRLRGFTFILSVKPWQRPTPVPMVAFPCWDGMLMNAFPLWFGFLPFFLLLLVLGSSVSLHAGWRWMSGVFIDRICRSSHPLRNWQLRIFMETNGDLNISFGVITLSSLRSTFVVIFCRVYRLLLMGRVNFRSAP